MNCVALIASLCLNGTAEIKLDTSSRYTRAVVSTPYGEIISFVSNDMVQSPDTKNMQRYCSDGGCLWYSQKCYREDGKEKCELYFAFSKNDQLRKVDIESESQDLLIKTKEYANICNRSICFKIEDLKIMSWDNFPPVMRWPRPKEE